MVRANPPRAMADDAKVVVEHVIATLEVKSSDRAIDASEVKTMVDATLTALRRGFTPALLMSDTASSIGVR